jgi:hypothetical protein
MKKTRYEKPTCMDAGPVAAIQGATCSSYGGSALDGCSYGHDPSLHVFCPNGYIATNNCQQYGSQANVGCFTGDSAVMACNLGNSFVIQS